jgi:flagellum-specific ATP synthase
VTVVGLVGERGREVGEFLENSLGVEGRARSVVVVSTSDQSPLLRMRAALAATAIAEFFAGQGKHVLLVLDSLTRFAMAAREIGLAAESHPRTRGIRLRSLPVWPAWWSVPGSSELVPLPPSTRC